MAALSQTGDFMKIAIIPILAIACIPSWVRADEIPAGYTLNRDGSKIVRSEEMEPRTQLIRVRSAGCPQFPNLTREQCRRLIEKNAELGRSRRRTSVVREKVYVVERDRDRSDRSYRTRDVERSGRCWPTVIRAKGSQRPGTGWATRVAKEAWQREVRFDAGEAYLTWKRARKVGGDSDAEPGIVCNESGISSIGVTQYRCEARAYPCKASEE
jgi:hypothetical protein